MTYTISPIVSLFCTNTIFVGILLATCGAYSTIKTYNKLNIIICLFGASHVCVVL